MIERVFNNGNPKDGRPVLIRIGNDFIEFFFNDYYSRHIHWLAEEEERRMESGEPELTEEEKEFNNFYWILVDDWKIKERNWEKHMTNKAWFSEKMLTFINDNVNSVVHVCQ